MLSKKRKPTLPGEILNEEFLKPLGVTQAALSRHLGCDVKTINRLVNGRTRIEPELAVKLGSAFNMSPEFWMNLQINVDIWSVQQSIPVLPGRLKLLA